MSKAGQVEAMMSYRMKARERKTILSIFNPLTKEKVSYKNVKNLYTNNIIAIYISLTFCSTRLFLEKLEQVECIYSYQGEIHENIL